MCSGGTHQNLYAMLGRGEIKVLTYSCEKVQFTEGYGCHYDCQMFLYKKDRVR